MRESLRHRRPSPSNFRRIQRGSSAPQTSEKRASFEKLTIGMMPGTIGISTPLPTYFVDKVEVGIGIVEILRNRRIGTCLDLANKIREIVTREAGLRMPFGISGNFDFKMLPGFTPNELYKFVGITKFASLGGAGRQIAAQRHNSTDTGTPELVQYFANTGARGTDTGKVRARPRIPRPRSP